MIKNKKKGKLMENAIKSIIKFAIDRENEAVFFYEALMERTDFKNQVKFLNELRDMELSHIKILQKIQRDILLNPSVPMELKQKSFFTNYIVEQTPEKKLEYQDILILGMKKEEKSYDFYIRLSKEFEIEEIQNVFIRLANEEMKHREFFNQLYNQDILKDN